MNFLLRASRAILLAVTLMSFAVSVAPIHAAPGVRANVTYQARLMDASGYPVADGVYQVEFSLYDAPVAGNRLWTADGTVGAPLPVNVTVQDGLFTVLLGDGVTQLPFGDIDWNSDSLYLGVTIGADGEMSPRRPITAVPQAINSAQLSGMSPSSTDTYGGESQFSILQASTTAATSTRSALDVRSNGTSVANDFILRAITNAGSPAFTITSQGVVSTTNLLVTGQNVCLADGTNCIAGSEADTLATVTARGSTTTVPLTFFGGATTSLLNVTSTASLIGNVTLGDAGSDLITVGGRFASSLVPTSPTGLSLGNSTNRWDGYFENTTATIIAATFVSSSQLVVAGQQVCLANGNNCLSATTSLQMAYDNGRFITLDDGRIQLEGVSGAQDEFSFNGLTATPILGAGYAGATNTGFDLSLAFNGTSGTFFSFTDNRNDPGATVNTSYLVHIPGNDNTLLLGNATSFIQFDNDIVDITNGSNEIFLDQGQQFFTADSDITGDTPFYFQDIGSQSSLLGLSNSNGLNLIHLGSDINPNGVYIPEDSGDLLIRSGSTGGAGTQLYVNVDGTDTGWRGVATTDMLAGSENLVSKLSENLILGDSISYIDVEGRMAFVIYSSGEWGIIDVTEPGQMVETYHQFGSAVHGQLVGKRLYVVDSNGFVEAYDVSDPTNASFLGDLTLPDPSYANNAHIVVEGSTIYFASDNYFVTIDARDPATMAVFADSGMPPGLFEYTNLIAQDGILYFSYKQIGNPDTEIAIFDVNDPVIFDSIGSGLFTSESQDDAQMAISDNRFYIKRHNGAEQVIDVYRTTNGMVDFGGGPLTTLDPSGDAIDHFEVYRGRIYVAAFIEGSTQKLFETFTTNFDGTYSSEQLLTNAFQTSDATDSPAIFNIEGAFAYGYDFDGVDHFIGVVDLGGMTTRSLRATNGDFGQLTVANGFTVRGTANFTNGITVDGRGVCLSDGTNCVSTAGDAITSIGVEDTNFDNLFIDAEGGLMLLIDDTASAWIYEVATREDGVTQLSGNGDAITGKLVGDRLFLVDTDGSLAIRDLTDPNNPVLLGGPTPITGGEGLSFDSGAQIEIEGNIAYFTATNTLRTIDISDPANISVLDSVNFADGDVRYPHIAIMDGVLYFASKRPNDIDASTTLFEAYNVQDPSNILLLGDMTQSARDRNDTQIAIMDRKIYFIRNTGTGDRLRAHSVATGFFGASIITLTPPVDSIGHFEVYRGHVYLSGYDEGGLQHQFYSYAYDGFDYTLEQTITDEVGTYDDGSSPANFDIDGSYLYGDYGFGQSAFGYLSLSGTKSRALSASNGEFGQMVIGDELSVQGFANFANGITVDGRGVCLSDGTNCVGGAGFSLAPMTVTSTVGTGFGTIYEVESDGGTLLVRNQLYDLSDPRNPVFVNTYASIPDSVSIQGSKLFGISTNVDGTSTLMSYDIRDLANPTLIADADLIDISAGGWAYKIEGSLLYYADDDAVSVYDIKDLSAPVLLGTVALPGAYSAPWIDYKDGFVYYTAVIDPSNTVIAVIDVRNPAAPTVLTDFSVLGSNNVAYYPKVVISDRRAYFSSRTTDMVVKSYDITDPANPVFLYNIVPTYGELHDFEVVGTRLYISAHSVDNADRNFERWNVASNSSASFIDAIENSGNENFVIAGGYAYLADSPDISVVDLGGLLATNIAAATADFGQLSIGNGGISVRGQSDFQNGLTVNGVGVCLSDGAGCPASILGSSLQSAYDVGRTIVLNDGKIELTPVVGAVDEFDYTSYGFFEEPSTPVIGAGQVYDQNSGFDLSLMTYGNSTGSLFTFTDNRLDPMASINTSYLSHKAEDNTLIIGNVTTSLRLEREYFVLTAQNSSVVGNVGYVSLTGDSDVWGSAPILLGDFGSGSSLVSLTNTLGSSVIHVVGDVDPNGTYGTNTSSDMLFRSGSTGGSGTQIYVNVDGTITGWRGLATVDMLTGGAGDLQSAYNNGSDITVDNGGINFYAASNTGSDFFYPGSPIFTTATRVFGAAQVETPNSGLDLGLFSSPGGYEGAAFMFSQNRSDPDSMNNNSGIRFLSGPSGYTDITMGNVSSSLSIGKSVSVFSGPLVSINAFPTNSTDAVFWVTNNVSTNVLNLRGTQGGTRIVDVDVGGLDPNGSVIGDVGDVYIRDDSSTSGTQMYLKSADSGSNTGWVGVATVDMLTGGSGDLQSAYDNGKVIVTSDGAIELIGSATATIVGTTDIPLLTATFVSGTNEGLDLALFSNSAVPLWSGTGTGMFYRHDQTIDVTNTTSSGLAFSDDGVQSYATLYTKQTGIGSFKYITLDNSGIDISPGSGGTTTFMNNVALNSGARFDSSILPRFTNTFGLGSSSLRWNNFVQSLDIAGTVTGDLTPSANLTYDLGSLGAAWNEAFIDTVTANTIGTSVLTVGGQNVCLLDGTNCPVTSLSWVYDGTNGLVRLTTSSNDIVLGASATSTGAPVYLETNQAVGTSTLFIGYSTSANVIIGGTSSTMSHMHSLFSGSFNGNDLYVGGNIGSASSVYTLGEFVAGSGSAHYGDGYLRQTIGDYTFEVAGGDILPATDLGINLGSSSLRFNGEFGMVTSTGIITDTLSVRAGIDARPQNGTQLATVISSSTEVNGAVTVAKVDGRRLVTLSDVTDSFEIVDISNPREPELIESYAVLGAAPTTFLTDMDVQGDTIAIMKSSSLDNLLHLYLYDISDYSNMTLLSDTTIGTAVGTESKVELDGSYVYVTYPSGGYVAIYNIANTEAIYEVSRMTVSGEIKNIRVFNDYAYIPRFFGGVGRVDTWSVREPANPVNTSNLFGIAQQPLDFVVQGNFGYLTYDNGDASIIDMTDPSAPAAQNGGDLCGGNVCDNLTIAGDYLLESYSDGGTPYIDLVDISVYAPSVPTYPVFPFYTPADGIRYYFDGSNATQEDIRFLHRAGDLIVAIQSSGSATSVVTIVDTGGIDTDGIRADSAEVGTLSVRGDAVIQEDLDVMGSLFVGYEGLFSQGGISSMSTSSISIFEGRMQIGDHRALATTTEDFSLSIAYTSTSMSGLCVRDGAKKCPTGASLIGNAIMADGSIATNAFDLAEFYMASGTVTAGDLVMFSDGATSTVEVTRGMAYDPRAIGVISTQPGFILGWEGDAKVALAGRVPVKVTAANGVIRVGDQLTSSEIAGTAMKATRAGMIVGIALQDTDIDGVIEMFIQPEFSLSTSIDANGAIQFTNESGSTTFSVDAAGNGYFLGDVSATSFTTHAAFDLAEQYSSPDKLEAGDLVMINTKEDRQMVRTSEDGAVTIGIVSTAPGFTLGASATGSYPIALAGRVPTKVTNMNGAIERGDALSASSIPGVAQKATVAGQIVGYALETYDGKDNGLIEVFVQPGYWMPNEKVKSLVSEVQGTSGAARQGFAKIVTGGSRVTIKYESILAFPVPQVTAMGNVSGGWWLEKVSDTGFEIVMDTIQPIDVSFAWQVSPAQAGIIEFSSDGTYGELDPLTGQRLLLPEPEEVAEPEPEPDPVPAPEVVIEAPSEENP